MRRIHIYITLFFCVLSFFELNAQQRTIYYTAQIVEGDTIYNAYLPETIVYPPLKFKNEEDRINYLKLVRDVKKTLPYARQVSQSIIETYQFMETLPNKKAKQKHLEAAQKSIMEEYKPKMKKLTKNQGKILVKLIDRQTNSSAYDIVKSLLGSFKAGVYNTLASLYGNNLKSGYDPEGKDSMIERIVVGIQQGTI